MHPARTLFATAAASAVLLLGAPGAYAAGPDKEHEDSSYSKEHDSGRDNGHHSEESWNDKKEDSWNDKKEDSWKDKHDENSWKGDHEKPKGGMHTGGGGLATPTVNAGGLAVLALAGTGLYAVRRRKTARNVA